ncbi:MAG: Hpt domain-containing protein [Eubacteriales bacterium]|nr:Hpt domain-containing protein [Eubacteriales bacterium]
MGKRRNYDIYIRNMFLVGCGLLLAFFLLGELCLPKDDRFFVGEAEKYQGEWEMQGKDGETYAIQTPCHLGGEKGETAVVRTTLPEDLGDHLVLCFYAVHQEMEFYVDGQLRQTYSNDDGIFFTRYAVRAYVPLQLSSADAGALLEVRVTGWGSEGIGTLHPVYLGTMDQVVSRIEGLHMPRVMMAVTLILIAAIVLIICLVLGRTLHRKIPMTWLCVSVIMFMTWLLADSAMRQFLLPNSAAAASMAYLVMLLAPAAFGAYLDLVQRQRYHRAYQGMETISCLAFFACFFLNMVGVDFVDMSGVVYYTLLIMVAVCGVNLVREVWSGHIKEYWMVAVGVLLTVLCGFVEIVMLLLQMDRFRQFSLCLSQLLFVIMAGFQTVSDIRQSIQAEKAKAEEAIRVKEDLAEALPAELLPLMESLDGEIHQLEGRIERDRSESLKAGMDRALSFLTSIRDLSSIQHDTDFTEHVTYQLDEFIQSARSFLDVRTKGRGLEGLLVVDPEIPQRLRGSLESCRYIFINLVEYAVQHTREGEVISSIAFAPKEEGFWLKISVASTGQGPQEEFREKLEVTDAELAIGGDIRLLSVRTMALRMGGRLVVESEEKEGFLITVLLPHRAADLESEAGRQRETPKTEETAVREERIQEERIQEESEDRRERPGEEPMKKEEGLEEEKEPQAQEESLIDREAGMVYCRGDQQMYQEILQVYLEEGVEQQARLSRYAEEGDWENYRILVHGIKSTSMNIGAESLARMAREQEAAAKDGRREELMKGWPALKELHGQVLKEIQGFLPEEEEEKENCLHGVKESLEGYDMDAALREVRRLTEEEAAPLEFLRQLEEAIEDFDYDRAQELLDGQSS